MGVGFELISPSATSKSWAPRQIRSKTWKIRVGLGNLDGRVAFKSQVNLSPYDSLLAYVEVERLDWKIKESADGGLDL